jgi:dienelactone hydrolase
MAAAAFAQPQVKADPRLIVALDVPTADEARALVAGTGWVAVTVDYELDAAEPYLTQPDNVRAALDWVRGNAAALGVDASRIGMLGSSAGGHLSMLVATTTGGVPSRDGAHPPGGKNAEKPPSGSPVVASTPCT